MNADVEGGMEMEWPPRNFKNLEFLTQALIIFFDDSISLLILENWNVMFGMALETTVGVLSSSFLSVH